MSFIDADHILDEFTIGRFYDRRLCRIVPGALPLSAGVVGAVATFKMQTLGEL